MQKVKLWVLVLAICIAAIGMGQNITTTYAAQTWTTWNLSFEGSTLRTIVPNGLTGEQSRISWLIEMADRSTATTDPLHQDSNGIIKPGDLIVVTNSMLMWFDLTCDQLATTNGGGGMLRGVWQIQRDGSNNLNFKRITNGNNYAPNLFYPGSKPGLNGSGTQILGNYGTQNVDNGFTWAIEHEANPVVTGVTGRSISEIDTGKYYDKDGVFVQIQGTIANSNVSLSTLKSKGIDSHYDVDNRSGVEGRAAYTLTYRIPASDAEWRQEINIRVTQNNFGALSTMVISNSIAGYEGQTVKYVADPLLRGGNISADSTQYFSMSGYSLQFYNLPWTSHAGTNSWSNTDLGTGNLAGIGAPTIAYPAPFIEMRPDINAMPAYFKMKFNLQCIDNQLADSTRTNALDCQYFDVNKQQAPQTFSQGASLDLNMDFGIH